MLLESYEIPTVSYRIPSEPYWDLIGNPWGPYRVRQDSIGILLESHCNPIRTLQGPTGFHRKLIGILRDPYRVL
eukprot:511394-Pyramimonas_sp.AAC.1